MDRKCKKPDAVKTETTRAGSSRVHFRERQVLRASALAAEQSYHVAARRRHNISHHGWGIVSGLKLTVTPARVDDKTKLEITPARIDVEPGMAVDGYGRELFVNAPLEIPTSAFETLQSEALDVWLFYEIREEAVALRGTWDCGPGRNPRTRERSRLRLTAAREVDPRRPAEVPYEDLTSPLRESPPDSPAREWPVYLGTIRNATLLTPLGFDPKSPRPYATLTGEMVIAPSGRALMQVGSELESDTRRFAVSVVDATGKLVERLAVDRDTTTVVTGNATIGNRQDKDALAPGLHMRKDKSVVKGGATIITEPLCGQPARAGAKRRPGAARMINFLALAATPLAAAPWQIYRTSVKEGVRTLRQLRVELKHPGDEGDPKLYRLAVGARDAAGDFKACFTVTADCTVTIEGTLQVKGQLIEGPVKADPSDPRFAAALSKQWATGVVAAESQLGQLFGGLNSGSLGVTITGLQFRRGSGAPQPLGKILFITPDDELLYAFTVRNNGQTKITNIQVYANLFFNGTRQRQEKLPTTPFDLPAGPDVVIPASGVLGPFRTEGKIEISVTAIGVGSVPNVLAATDSATITVINLPDIT
jgi:hypothetical protein